MRHPAQYLALLRHMGPGWMCYRLVHALRRRSGLLRKATPAVPWDQVRAPRLALFLKAQVPAMADSWGDACLKEAEAILAGRFRLFSRREAEAGFPPDWHRNQLVAAGGGMAGQAPLRHWTEISDAGRGDIKGVWELSRFPWAFPLVRARARNGDPRFAAAFWRLFEDWCVRNPPNLGPNWMCGQEATFRLMATVFAVESFEIPEAHRLILTRFVVATGQRISAHLDYALSQKNNHGISECVGLITAGLLLPDDPIAAGWIARGLQHLDTQLAELVYEDGGFSQHSLIYHRVLLHDLCWCRRRMEQAGRTIPPWLNAAAQRGLEHLLQVADPQTGRAPLYGSNDGANVLPLADVDYLDLRPVIQMTSALFQGKLMGTPGPWDEAAAWLSEDWQALPRTPWVPQPRWHAAAAGNFQLWNGDGRLFLRCPTRFRHRPAQADMAHVDIWLEGQAVASDGGSFSYNSSERFTALGAACHHNALTVDGREPMKKFSRFLYLPWPKGTVSSLDGGGLRYFHDGYANAGVHWTREVWPGVRGGFVVRDLVRGAAGHQLTWSWRLADLPWLLEQDSAVHVQASGRSYRIRWSGAPSTSRLMRADGTTAHGWWSPYYAEVQPAVALLLEVGATGDIEWTTEFLPEN